MPNSLIVFLVIAAYLALAYLCWPGCHVLGKGPLKRVAMLFPWVGHAWLLQDGVLQGGGFSLGFSASVSAMMALTVLLYSFATWRYSLGVLQSAVLVLAAGSVALHALLPGPVAPQSESPISSLHLLMAFGAYGSLTVAALHALLIAFADRHLHQAVPPAWISGLPPLLTLERLLFRLIEFGFVVLTLTLISGFLFSESIYGKAVPFTHMTVFGLASWGIFAALLVGRRLRGWRGRRAIWWTLAGFVSLLLAYVGVKFVLEVLLGRV